MILREFLNEDLQQRKGIIKSFDEGKLVKFDIRCVILVPDRICTAICFPQDKLENVDSMPFMTLMCNKWERSGELVDACLKENSPFKFVIDKLANKDDLSNQDQCMCNKFQINGEDYFIYLVSLMRAIEFDSTLCYC